MDLAKILSPVDDEDRQAAVCDREDKYVHHERGRTRNGWSQDEMQCAAAILHDFHHPVVSNGWQPRREVGTLKSSIVPPTTAMNQEQTYNDITMENGRIETEEGKSDTNMEEYEFVEGSESDEDVECSGQERSLKRKHPDPLSRLDLLVQADAMITEHHDGRTQKNTRRNNKKDGGVNERKKRGAKVSGPDQLRSGFWSKAEEEYAAALISYFLAGKLSLTEGITLRKYLAEQLHCNRRRISMKLATEKIGDTKVPRRVGASIFAKADLAASEEELIEMHNVLEKLRRACFASTKRASPMKENKPHCMDIISSDTTSVKSPASSSGEVGFPKIKSPSSIKRRRPLIIRTGFDSQEEETYVTALFEYFMDGVLDLPENTRLVTFLCEQLGCSAKTLSMKLAPRKLSERKFPDNLGTITYSPRGFDPMNEVVAEAEARLCELRQLWLDGNPVQEKQLPSPALSSSSIKSPSSPQTPLSPSCSRSGPWCKEEEEYAAALIDCFLHGILDLAEGTSLRAFLASRLQCNPMRISKKLASDSIAHVRIPKKLGSSTFVRNSSFTSEQLEQANQYLHERYLAYAEAQQMKETSHSYPAYSYPSAQSAAFQASNIYDITHMDPHHAPASHSYSAPVHEHAHSDRYRPSYSYHYQQAA